MKNIFKYLLFFSCFGYAQDRTSELLNTLASDVVKSSESNYFLLETNLTDYKIVDSLVFTMPVREFYIRHPDFPNFLLNTITTKNIKWNNINLKNAHLITQNQGDQITQTVKNVLFVYYDINSHDLQQKNNEIDLNTFIVKRSKSCNDEEIWNQVQQTWNDIPEWKKIYYSFSDPIFSKDYKYARVAVLEMRKCSGGATTYIYKYENNIWVQIGEYPNDGMKKVTTHIRCEDLNVRYVN
jgi:hypothetical protein